MDLAEDWFDDRLAPGVGALASFGAELAGHPLLGREVLRDPTCGRRLDEFVAFESARGDQELGAGLGGDRCGCFQVRLAAVPGVGEQLLGFPSGVAADPASYT